MYLPATMTPEIATSTRNRLIETARRLFREQGYGATGIAQILKEADVKSGSLYYFFPTKEDLLLAVLSSYKEIMADAVVTPVFERVSDPIERIFGMLDGYRQMLISTECKLGCPIGNLTLEISESHPNAREILAETFSSWRDVVKTCIESAMDRLPEGIDAEELATFVLVTMEGSIMLARAYRNTEPYDAAVTHLRAYFDKLIEEGTNWSK